MTNEPGRIHLASTPCPWVYIRGLMFGAFTLRGSVKEGLCQGAYDRVAYVWGLLRKGFSVRVAYFRALIAYDRGIMCGVLYPRGFGLRGLCQRGLCLRAYVRGVTLGGFGPVGLI